MNGTDGKKLLLIVDDAPANLQMMRSILKDDFKIRVATSGAKALDLVKAAGGIEMKEDLSPRQMLHRKITWRQS
jgi:CheY-like chemotaxis protein